MHLDPAKRSPTSPPLNLRQIVASLALPSNFHPYIHTKSALESEKYEEEYYLLFNENWQLLSYEEIRTDSCGKHHTIFKLEDPEFDSPDFNNEDAAAVYEKLKAEMKKKDKTANNQ